MLSTGARHLPGMQYPDASRAGKRIHLHVEQQLKELKAQDSSQFIVVVVACRVHYESNCWEC